MEVEGAMSEPEERRRDDPAIVREHDQGGLERHDIGDRVGVAQAGRRQDLLDPERLGCLRDRRPGRLEASAGGSGRRGHDADEVDVGIATRGREATADRTRRCR